MEKSKTFTVKQTQAGDDSGYSCTSTQSKYSQSASSGDSCFGERRISNTTDKRKSFHLNSTSRKKQNKAVSREVAGLKTTVNSDTNNKNSKSEQINLSTFETQRDQNSIDVSESKEHLSISKMEMDDSNDLNDGIKNDHDKNNTAYLQLANICQSYRDFLNTKNLTPNSSDESTSTDTGLKILNEGDIQLKEMNESDKIHENTFGVVVSMNNGFVINTSDNIYRSMGYPKNMWQGRSFIDFIHPEDRESFISYVTSVLIDPSTILRKDGTSTVTFLSAKNKDGFYCNMRRYNGLVNTGFSLYQKQNLYQVCKLTITFKDSSQFLSASSTLATANEIIRPQLLIINAQLIYSAYTYPEEKNDRPATFITKHNALFKWCYVDHLIISHFGYLPQNIIGKSIFAYYNIEDLSTIKEIYENITTPRNVPYKGHPYRFKCQNGDFALIQTEWSNFVNPWSGRVEFVVGKHKVIQGPVNPDVTTPVDGIKSKEKSTENIKTENEAYEDIKKILNKNIYEDTDVSLQINQTPVLSSSAKQQLSKKCVDLELSMSNCFVEDPPINVPLEVSVQPEMCGSFSNHDSVIFGGISPHHNYESKSSSGTPLSYNQLNYNDNILRFFKSNLYTNSSDDELTQTEGKSTPFDNDVDKVQQESPSLLQSATSSSSITVNDTSTNCNQNLDENMSQSSQQPLTQKMLLRHNKKMEDDLVKQHKNKAQKNKSNEKQQQKLLEENKEISNINHGIKRSNSTQYEENPCKFAKKKHQATSNPTNVFTQTQENKNVESDTSTVARSTQIWPPCKITRDSQTTVDLPCQVLCYNVPLTNNVMPVKHNEYDNIFTLMDASGQNQESLPALLQPMNVPFYATIPVMNHIPQNPQILQPCSLLCHNQLLLQPYENNVQCENQIHLQNEISNSMLPRTDLYQQTKASVPSEVNQEEIITSSDSECKRDIRSLKSSNGWMYEYSSFYSSSLRDSNSDKEEHSCLSDFNKPNFFHQFIKKQPIEDDYKTPDLIFRYQMEHGDMQEVLRKDMNALNTLIQPVMVNEQLKQLSVELEVNGTSKTSYFEDGTSSSGEDEYLISVGENKRRRIDFSRMAMIYEENAPLPPPITPHEMSSKIISQQHKI